jgi:DNA-binding CsgD family transcriptional regulator
MIATPLQHTGDTTAFLLSLMDGAFETPPWSSFLDQLLRRTNAGYASLVFRPPGLAPNTVFHLFAGEKFPPSVQKLYRESFYKRDPTPYHQMLEGRVYSLNELLKPGDPARDSYVKEMLSPSGMNALRMMRLVEPTGVNAWLSITRRHGDFNENDDALLSGIAPYLRSVLRSFVALEQERVNALLSGDAIRRLNFGWIMLDAAGYVLDADAQAKSILAESTALRQTAAGLLTAKSRALSREIAAAIKALATDEHARPRAMIVNEDPWLDMLLVPANRRSMSAKSAPTVIAYVHGDNWLSADRCEQIADLFGLLPSEARLALALGRGMSIADAATDLGLTIETARTYTKKIYAKMGARGQADLVRFLHRSILGIA